jgi:hypothetical protein
MFDQHNACTSFMNKEHKNYLTYFLLEKIAEKDTIGAVVRVKLRNFRRVSQSI